MTDGFPAPACRYGFTAAQVNEILGNDDGLINGFGSWMEGQTVAYCDGSAPLEHRCFEPHGMVVYASDIAAYLRGAAPLD
jgi:hypothetical protein